MDLCGRRCILKRREDAMHAEAAFLVLQGLSMDEGHAPGWLGPVSLSGLPTWECDAPSPPGSGSVRLHTLSYPMVPWLG